MTPNSAVGIAIFILLLIPTLLAYVLLIYHFAIPRDKRKDFFKKYEIYIGAVIGLVMIACGPEVEERGKIIFSHESGKIFLFGYMGLYNAFITIVIWEVLIKKIKEKGNENA